MDIGSGKGYPSSALSNFSPHPFEFDGVKIASMEGFLQSLKFKEVSMQKHICTLVGRAAKAAGRHKNWQVSQNLHWNGKVYQRESDEYQALLDKVYLAMYKQSESFRNALIAAGNAVFRHSIGRSNAHETVLTKREFCGRLMELKILALIDKDTLKGDK